jgi:hypothetical protein
VQHVEGKVMEVDFNMLLQNHVHYNKLSKKITLWGGGAMVKDLINVEVRSSSPHTYNLGYLGYLGDIIKYLKLQRLLNHLV